MHGLPLPKFFGQVITSLGTGSLKPFQALFQGLACMDRIFFHVVNLDLDLVHTVCSLLLLSRLIHSTFQCPESFHQLLAINAKLLSESTIVLLYRALLYFQLSNLGQQLRLSPLHLSPKCKDFLLECHQALPSFSVNIRYRHTVPVVVRGLHKDPGSSCGEFP